MIHRTQNNRRLIISDVNNLAEEISDGLVPSSVLLTAWSSKEALPGLWDDFVYFLLENHCISFVCAGTHAEALHDEIDEILYRYEDDFGVDMASKVITTFHSTESAEEVVNFFVYGTEIKGGLDGCLVAILNKNDTLDAAILHSLLIS